MKSKLLAAALLGTAVIGGAAFAQDKSTTTTANPPPAASADQKMNLKGTWRTSKLMGLDVYNDGGEKLGDINELLVDKDGKVHAVVIGVGGFLGMGEHDIAVSMDKLRFMEEPVKTSSTSTTSTTQPANSKSTTGSTTTSSSTSNANDWVPDHAVMSGTKDQLKTMPQFKYSDYN